MVQLKGRAAAEVDSTDEVLVAELMLGGVFNELSPAALTALCSCLIAPDVEKVKRCGMVDAAWKHNAIIVISVGMQERAAPRGPRRGVRVATWRRVARRIGLQRCGSAADRNDRRGALCCCYRACGS